MQQKSSQQPILGSLTYTNLGNLSEFSRKERTDAFGASRVPLSPALARMSAELAANVYSLNVAPWIQAGFTDCSFIIEDRVVTLDRDSDTKLAAIEAEWRRRRARSLIRGVKPIGDLLRAARQLFMTNMSKCVVMAQPTHDGQAIIAISFIGTTQKFFDWFSNFKMHQSDGMHYGFMALARQFDAQASRIHLPTVAAAFGRESFTLADAVLEAQKPESRITLWISGHSQGGALVQTYTHLLLSQGVLPERIFAYSFAAPSVSTANGSIDPKAYPIYNIINTDDAVPNVGAQVRLGVDCFYTPNDAFRGNHYRLDEEIHPAFDRMLVIGKEVRTTGDALCWGIALMELMQSAETDEALSAFFSGIIPHLSAFRRMKLDMRGIALYLLGLLAEQHKQLTGQPPDTAKKEQYEEMMRNAIREFGPSLTAHALTKRLMAPHRIQPDKRVEEFVPPYIAIVRRYLTETEQGIWLPSSPSRCVNAKGELILSDPYDLSALEIPSHEGSWKIMDIK